MNVQQTLKNQLAHHDEEDDLDLIEERCTLFEIAYLIINMLNVDYGFAGREQEVIRPEMQRDENFDG